MQCVFRQFLCLTSMAVTAGFVGCGGAAKLPAPAERLPGKWHGEMIVYDETQGKLPADKINELAQMQWDFDFRKDGAMILSGVHAGQAYSTEGRWETIKQDGDVLMIKSLEQSGDQKDIKIEFDGQDTFYIPVDGKPAPDAEVAELGAMRFTRLR